MILKSKQATYEVQRYDERGGGVVYELINGQRGQSLRLPEVELESFIRTLVKDGFIAQA